MSQETGTEFSTNTTAFQTEQDQNLATKKRIRMSALQLNVSTFLFQFFVAAPTTHQKQEPATENTTFCL